MIKMLANKCWKALFGVSRNTSNSNLWKLENKSNHHNECQPSSSRGSSPGNSDYIRESLECPICMEISTPPIHNCSKGHIVCNDCLQKLQQCPICRTPFSPTVCSRNLMAERMFETLPATCPNASLGCNLNIEGSDLDRHLKVCDYRPVECIDCGCQKINYGQYKNHLMQFHKIGGVDQNTAYVFSTVNLAYKIQPGQRFCNTMYYLNAFGKTFLIRLYATHSHVCAWISLLGLQSDCSKYEAVLESHTDDDMNGISLWEGPVNHFRDDASTTIFKNGRGLITPLEVLTSIAKVESNHVKWFYMIEIFDRTATKKHKPNGNGTKTSLPSIGGSGAAR